LGSIYYATIRRKENGTQIEATWNAISATQEAVGQLDFEFCYFEDATAGLPYDDADFPVDIPLNHQVYGNYAVRNTGTIALGVRLYIEFIDPNNIVRDSGWDRSIPLKLDPGVVMSSDTFGPITLDKLGSWKIYGLAEYNSI